MLKKYGYMALVVLPIMILLAWVATIEVQRHSGQEVEVAIGGYDPRDLLSGHYIQYQIDWEEMDCSQFENGKCPTQDFGYWGRYYVPEDKALDLEKVIRDSENKVSIVFSYHKGMKPLALRLLVNGKDWQTAVDKD